MNLKKLIGLTGLLLLSAIPAFGQTPSGAYSSPTQGGSTTSGSVAAACGGTANVLLRLDGTGVNCVASTVTDAGSGVTVGSPTGGAEGAGTLNATGLYVNGVPVGTGSGTVTTSGSPTTNAIPKFTGSTVVGNSSCSDNATTVSCTEPFSAVSLSSSNDGVHPGSVSWVGNTTNPSVTANTANIFGPTSATFTAYALQLPATGPTNTNNTLQCGTPTSSVSACSFGAALSGISFPQTVAGTTTSGGIPYFSSTTALTSSGILNSNILVKGGGAGGAPTNSSITDNGTAISTSENITANQFLLTTTSGMIPSGGTNTIIEANGSNTLLVTSVGIQSQGTGADIILGGAGDTFVSRNGANVVDVGSAVQTADGTVATGKFTSTVATGTAPIAVTSTTTVPNLTVSNHPKVQFCGTTSTCSHTAEVSGQVVYGSAALVSGTPSTVTISGISPAFTATADYVCTVSAPGASAATALLGVTNVSASSFTITGPATVSTVISYVCAGF